MTYKTHLTAGLLFSSIYFLEIRQTELSFLLIISIILSATLGSSAPDLDTPSGPLWKKIPAGSILARIVRPVFIGGHRYLSHSLIGFVLFNTLFYLFLKLLFQDLPSFIFSVQIAFSLSYITHLFADMFTEAGVPLLFPLEFHFGIPPTPFQKVRIKTGRWFENLIIYPILNIALLYVIIKGILLYF